MVSIVNPEISQKILRGRMLVTGLSSVKKSSPQSTLLLTYEYLAKKSSPQSTLPHILKLDSFKS